MRRGLSTILSVVMVLTISLCVCVPVVASDAEVECEACYELITTLDVIYNDEGEAMCIYCEEILGQKVLDALFNEETEEETEELCSVCGEKLDEYAIFTDDGFLICSYCSEEEEEIHESDDPDDYIPNPNEVTGIVLNTSEWAKAEADEAFARNLIPIEMLGTDLKMDVTREQFAAIAVALYESVTGRVADDSTEGLPFTDCSPTGTYSRYVAAAYKLGITNGTSETTFDPSQIITREQLATMLYRVITKAQADGATVKEVATIEIVFEDGAQISDYATESVYYMAQRGIIKGMSETQFAPLGVATKEQAILISNRIVTNLY